MTTIITRTKQNEIAEDYRLCHEAMGDGRRADRIQLSQKYGVPCETVADLWRLGRTLFSKMDEKSKKADKMQAETALRAAASAFGRMGGSVKSEAKARAARENGKNGGRPKVDR
jgi:hypothetical protein